MSSKSVVFLWRYILQFFEFSRWPPPPSWIFKIGKFYWLFRSRGSRRICVPNFVKIGQSVAKILRFFDFSRWWLPPSWTFKFVKCYWLTVSGEPRRITVPNFVKIDCSVAILQFLEFSRWPPQPSWIYEIAKFYWLLRSRGSSHIGMPNFVKIGQSIAKIFRFFNFSRWRQSAILDLFGSYLDHQQWVLRVSIALQNLVMIDAVVFIIWTFQYLARLAGKCLFTPPKLGFLAICFPKWAAISSKAKTAHPCVSLRHLGH